VELQKAQGLGTQAVLEPRLGLHLQLQLHHRLAGRSRHSPLRPEHIAGATAVDQGQPSLK
jgi:hypothetical protein